MWSDGKGTQNRYGNCEKVYFRFRQEVELFFPRKITSDVIQSVYKPIKVVKIRADLRPTLGGLNLIHAFIKKQKNKNKQQNKKKTKNKTIIKTNKNKEKKKV